MDEMANALIRAKDSSQLEEVSISGTLGGGGGAYRCAIAEMLKVNTTLKKLELHLRSRTDEDEPGIVELSKALIKNKTLTKFQLHGATNSSGSWNTRTAFLNMLRTNYTLFESALVFHPGFLRPESDLYLKLNHVGRGRLLENANVKKDEWVNALIKVRDDIDCLFYFLITNPSLCSSSSSSSLSLPPVINGITEDTIEQQQAVVESLRKRKLSAVVTPQPSSASLLEVTQ
mgnify:CR=1 FL=1